MRNKSFAISFTLVILIILLLCVGCQKKGCTDPNALNYNTEAKKDNISCEYQDFDKYNLLKNLSDAYITTSLSSYNDKINTLNNDILSFTSNPSISGLSTIRNSWEEALLNWQDVAFLDFGPSEYILLRSQTNTFPIDTTELQNSITSGTWNFQNSTFNDSKGLQALDYLLFKPGYTDTGLITYFQSDTNATNYLKSISEDLLININYVTEQWDLQKGDFINDFETTNTGYSSNSQGSSISNIINALCLHYEFYVRRGKVGLPMGVFNGFSQQELPHLVECFYSGKSFQNAIRSISSIRKFINGSSYIANDNGLGLDDYMNFVNAELNSEQLSIVIDNQIITILNELDNYSNTLSQEIMTNKTALSVSYGELQRLVPYIKVDMTSALGVLITYQDNDGD